MSKLPAVSGKDAVKALKDAESSNEKLRAAISLAKGFVEYDRAAAFDGFRQIVDTINKLPPPVQQKDNADVMPFPTVDELIKSFRLLAQQDEAGAFTMAQEIETTELRVAALSGVYSHPRSLTK